MTSLVKPGDAVEQPPLFNPNLKCDLTVAISSLSVGGAELIVLDWAARIHPRWRVHLIVLRNRDIEWPVPDFIRVTRVTDMASRQTDQEGSQHDRRLKVLRQLGIELAASENPVCVCHLLGKDERDALADSGAHVVPVLHNARDGWLEGVSGLEGSPNVIAVSEACSNDLRNAGWEGPVSVIRHIPPRPRCLPGSRESLRKSWGIPCNATVIGMIGSVKPQKNYARAIRILKAVLQQKDAYLVIIGGPSSRNAKENWIKVKDAIREHEVKLRVCMTGTIENAATCLSAFDVVLNTSHFEGLSIATLEALVSGIPVVASKVGGQGELGCESLTLLATDASDDEWASALIRSMQQKPELPAWSMFESHHLWTLAGLSRVTEPSEKVLFVTANLNSGGAQRSLVNLSIALRERGFPFSVAVAGNSTDSYFYDQLRHADVEVQRLADSGRAFHNAEALVYKICSENIGTVCFWNLDPKVKLLVLKTLGFTKVRFIDVSPGDESFDKMNGSAEFQHLIAYSKEQYYGRLDQLVLKYHGPTPASCREKTWVIPNGIPDPRNAKSDYSLGPIPRIIVCGRIDPTKFLLEILEAMRLVRQAFPSAELHVYGAAEPKRLEYAEQVARSAEAEIGKCVFFHGVNFEVTSVLYGYDGYVVLGRDQGCPNALLEALACGVPAIGNDDGGTREQLVHEKTGLLVSDCSPGLLADSIIRILSDRKLAMRLGIAGRKHVMEEFSMSKMAERYLQLLGNTGSSGETEETEAASFDAVAC